MQLGIGTYQDKGYQIGGMGDHELPFEPNTIDYILITHSHIDHSGRVPMLIKQGFTWFRSP